MKLFTEFYIGLRTILGDRDPHGVFEYQDDILAGGIQTMVQMGYGPVGYSLNTAGDGFENDIPNGNDVATVFLQTALLLVGGEDSEIMSYTTRALSVRRKGDRRSTLIGELKEKIYAIELGADGFVTGQDCVVWLMNRREHYPCKQSVGPREGGYEPGPCC